MKPKYAWIYEKPAKPPTPQEKRAISLLKLRQYEAIGYTYMGKKGSRSGE